MKFPSIKIVFSVLCSSLIVSGIVYAATISSVTQQTINAGDTIGQGWFQAVNDSIGTPNMQVYSCPRQRTCNDGQVISGQWASHGCVGQISSTSSCEIIWWNNGLYSCSNGCTALGKIIIK